MEVKKIENCNYVMFPRLQHCGLKPEHVERDLFVAELKHVEVMATTGSCTNSRSPMWWLTSNFPAPKQSLITSLASAWARTIGATTSRMTLLSFALLPALMPLNSPPSTPTSSARESMPSTPPPDGGTSTVTMYFY